MHNTAVEMQGKCRRLFYAKVTFGDVVAGDALGVASGGGAISDLTGSDLIIATFNDLSAPERIGCIEEYYSPVHANKPLSVDLTLVGACHHAVDAHRVAKKAEAAFTFETAIKLFGSESSPAILRHMLTVEEIITGADPDRSVEHGRIAQIQNELEALSRVCSDCCESLLDARDAAITWAAPSTQGEYPDGSTTN